MPKVTECEMKSIDRIGCNLENWEKKAGSLTIDDGERNPPTICVDAILRGVGPCAKHAETGPFLIFH